jgi:hypothetical protein
MCSDYDFSASQFGFVPNRGSGKAVALAHDVGVYANACGSTVFYCSLDAQGAFDFLPHSVLLNKAIGVVPDGYWNCVYNWYSNMCVFVRWGTSVGDEICVNRGTRQGGLTSPFMFNLFYKDLIEDLNKCNYGITISGFNFNVMCYADDILICSVTSHGLQCLINKAEEYIKNNGLRFNPAKTECMLFGKCPFIATPHWTMDNVSLSVVPSMKYLGTMLCYDNGTSHIESRKSSAQKAYYSLQGAGVKYNGVELGTAVRIYQTAVESVIGYGCSSIHLSKSNSRLLDTLHCKQLKNIMGLKYSAHSSPILGGLSVLPISVSIAFGALTLFRSCLQCSSNTGVFYKLLMKNQSCVNTEKTLLGRVNSFLTTKNIRFQSYVLNDDVLCKLKKSFYIMNGHDGLIDSVRSLCNNYNDGSRQMLGLLLKSF